MRHRRCLTVIGLLTCLLGAILLAGCAPSVAGQSSKSVSAEASAGRQLFTSRGCIACHIAPGVPGATGTLGPNLTGVGDAQKRPQLADGKPNTTENLRKWIQDPASQKPGTMMPNLNLSDKEADELVAFLLTLK